MGPTLMSPLLFFTAIWLIVWIAAGYYKLRFGKVIGLLAAACFLIVVVLSTDFWISLPDSFVPERIRSLGFPMSDSDHMTMAMISAPFAVITVAIAIWLMKKRARAVTTAATLANVVVEAKDGHDFFDDLLDH